MVDLGQAAALAYVDVEGNQVVPEARDAFLCTLNNLISNTNLQSANEDYMKHTTKLQFLLHAVSSLTSLHHLHGFNYRYPDHAHWKN